MLFMGRRGALTREGLDAVLCGSWCSERIAFNAGDPNELYGGGGIGEPVFWLIEAGWFSGLLKGITEAPDDIPRNII